jgi:hypothetical protein
VVKPLLQLEDGGDVEAGGGKVARYLLVQFLERLLLLG